MRVVHVINSLTIGGAEVLLANSLANNALPAYIKNTLVFFEGESSLLKRIDPTVEIINLGYKNKFYLPKVLKKLHSILKTEQVDIVHTHLNPAGFYTSLVCPRYVKQVHTMHTIYSLDSDTRGSLKWLEKKALLERKKANLIFLSSELQKDLTTLMKFKGQSYILSNFVNDSFFNGRARKIEDRKQFRIVSVGLKEAKNHLFSIEVFKYLKDKNIILDIYGDENLQFYQEIINETQVPIRLKGKIENLHEVLPSYDLFFMPSKYEGYPLSVLEAMATGIPVLLSDIMPLKDMGKQFAFYFSLESPRQVAEQIMKLKSNPDLLVETSELARKYAENVGRKEKYVEGLLKIYRDILSRNNQLTKHL